MTRKIIKIIKNNRFQFNFWYIQFLHLATKGPLFWSRITVYESWMIVAILRIYWPTLNDTWSTDNAMLTERSITRLVNRFINQSFFRKVKVYNLTEKWCRYISSIFLCFKKKNNIRLIHQLEWLHLPPILWRRHRFYDTLYHRFLFLCRNIYIQMTNYL